MDAGRKRKARSFFLIKFYVMQFRVNNSLQAQIWLHWRGLQSPAWTAVSKRSQFHTNTIQSRCLTLCVSSSPAPERFQSQHRILKHLRLSSHHNCWTLARLESRRVWRRLIPPTWQEQQWNPSDCAASSESQLIQSGPEWACSFWKLFGWDNWDARARNWIIPGKVEKTESWRYELTLFAIPFSLTIVPSVRNASRK